jgi:hypothetical protein
VLRSGERVDRVKIGAEGWGVEQTGIESPQGGAVILADRRGA